MAVEPPSDVVELIAGLSRPALDGIRWTTRDQWHVTLRFLGSVERAEPVIEALTPVASRIGAFDVTLGPEVARFAHRVLHIPVHGLEGLASAVVRATAEIGEPPEDRPFTGHVTLARATGARRGRGTGASKRHVDLRPLCGTPIAASWRVGSFALVESHLGRGGARYEDVEAFPLR